jgi:uncharacterized protein (TIGR00251 family)
MLKPSNKEQKSLIISIKVEPRSSKSGISGYYGNALKVKLNSPPVEGKANKELIEVLAREFKISKKDIEIIRGEKSKNKIVRLNGIKSIEDWTKKPANKS